MYIRRFKYKPDDVDCRLCTEFRKRKCTLEGCPWIAERIEAGVVSYAEAAMKVFSSYGLLRHRLADLVDSYPGTFWIDERHRNRMEWFNHQLGYNPRRNTPAYYAALYLLTSSEELHRRTSNEDRIRQLPQNNPLRNAEMSLEDDYGMIDGIINNGKAPGKEESKDRKPSVIEQLKNQPQQSRKKSTPKKNKEKEL